MADDDNIIGSENSFSSLLSPPEVVGL